MNRSLSQIQENVSAHLLHLVLDKAHKVPFEEIFSPSADTIFKAEW